MELNLYLGLDHTNTEIDQTKEELMNAYFYYISMATTRMNKIEQLLLDEIKVRKSLKIVPESEVK